MISRPNHSTMQNISDQPAFVIAIDGPAASGKGTLARKLSEQLGLLHLDTGLTYRAVAKAMLDAAIPLNDEEAARQVALNIDLGNLDRAELSAHDIGEAASKVAVMSTVRQALVKAQQTFANTPPGTILDGRDIGTVVCPNAAVKLYVTASPQERTRRRWNELTLNGNTVEFDDILQDLKMRDARDMGRDNSPLRPAKDAHLLDTSQMDIETAFKTALRLVDEAKSKSRR